MSVGRRPLSERPPPSVLDLPWQERFVPGCDGTRLYVRQRRGSADVRITAVLCDGIACDGFVWRYLNDDLLPVANVLHHNYRGHGRSAAPADPERIGMDALAADIDAVRLACLHQPAVLFGHSLGCQVALEAYRTRPEGVAGLVLICGAPGRVTHTFKGGDALARALPAIIARVERHPQIARALWSNLPPAAAARVALVAGEVDPELDPADLLAYMEHVANLDVIMFLRMLQSVGEETAEDVLPTVAVPVLVIAGDGDTFTPPPLAERMATTIPDAELMLAAGATHVVPLERREAVRERILGFLQGRVLPRLAPTARAAGRA